MLLSQPHSLLTLPSPPALPSLPVQLYLGLVRLMNRAAADAVGAMTDEQLGRAEAAGALLQSWLRSCLRRYAEATAGLVGRLREELGAHREALGGPVPDAFVEALREVLGVSL